MNDKEIFEKVKMKIAIFNNEERNITVEKNENKIGKSIGIVAGIILSTTVLATTGITLTKKYADKFGNNSSQGVQIAVENDYIEKVNMEHQTSEGIDISVDYFLLDDANFDIVFDIKFDEKYNVNEMLGLELVDLKVVDETGKKVFATMEAEAEEDNIEELYKDKEGSKNNYKLYFGGYSNENKIVGEHEIKNYVTATGNPVNFPNSKKLIVTFSKIKVTKNMENPNENPIYNGQWKFELDVPEKMYSREIVYYKAKNITGGDYIIEKAQLSNTAFKIYLSKTEDLQMSNEEYVETTNGKKFYISQRNDGDGELSIGNDRNSKYYNTFNLTKFDATENLKVHLFKNNGQEVIIEMEKVK